MTMSDGACISLRTHFISSAVLVCHRFLTPRPPSVVGRHTILYLTKACPLVPFVSAPRQKNRLMMASMQLQIPMGSLNNDMKYVGIAESTAFRRTRRPHGTGVEPATPLGAAPLPPKLAAILVLSSVPPRGEVPSIG